MINELFERLPPEIAFQVLTWRKHETAEMIKKAITYAHNYNCVRPTQMEEKFLSKFLKRKLIIEELGYLIDDMKNDNDDNDFYEFFFSYSIPEYINEGFYIMDESDKPPRVNVGHHRDTDYDDDE